MNIDGQKRRKNEGEKNVQQEFMETLVKLGYMRLILIKKPCAARIHGNP
jgi:hypothetical protein